MKKNPRIGERIRSQRGDRTQAEFADLLKVSQAAVSALELGENLPSAETCFRLATLAPDPEDKVFFFKLGGVEPQALICAANRISEERNAPAKPGEVVRLPLHRMAARGVEETGAQILMPAERIPSPRSTIGVTLDEGSSNFAFAPGDILFIDSSRPEPLDLPSFFNEMVAMIFTATQEYRDTAENPWPRKLIVGRMRPPQQSGVYGQLIRLATLDDQLHREVLTICEWNEYPSKMRAPGYNRAPFEDVSFNTGWEMIGRVVAWSKKL